MSEGTRNPELFDSDDEQADEPRICIECEAEEVFDGMRIGVACYEALLRADGPDREVWEAR